MLRSDSSTPEGWNNNSPAHEKLHFNAEVFYERATDWGATPLRHIPEQNDVCNMLVQRVDDLNQYSDPLVANYMRTVYYGRFHVRQERNYSAYTSRLNKTPYEELTSEVQCRSDRSMVGLATIEDALFLQDDYQMGSNELARKTHPNQDISSEYEAIESEIFEACVELDPDTYVPASKDRYKIRGSDMITLPEYNDKTDSENRRVRLLFVTRKSTVAVLPHSDTVVVRRQNYILDLDEFSQSEPRVAEVLRSYDVNTMDPDEWSKKLTSLWRDIDAMAPLVNDQTRRAFKDLSTTYYTVNKYRLELIRIRNENDAHIRLESESDEMKKHRAELAEKKDRQNGKNTQH